MNKAIKAGLVLTVVSYGIWIADKCSKQEAYIDTGIVVYRINENEGTTLPPIYYFEYDGETYVDVICYFRDYTDPDTDYYTSEEYLKGKPENLLFNLRDKPGMYSVLYGPYWENVYKLPNEAGYVLLTTEECIYCKESELDEVLEYYKQLGVPAQK